jgi:hypothetical protein
MTPHMHKLRRAVVKLGYSVRCNRPLRFPNYEVFLWHCGGPQKFRLSGRTPEMTAVIGAGLAEQGMRVASSLYHEDHTVLEILDGN